MSDANNMRKYLEVLNERAPDVPYQGKHDANPNINYSTEQSGGEINKVIAHLTADPSGRYTKLGRNLLRMERIEARMKALKAEVKEETRELIGDLFHAADACRTREVDTVSFIFQMTKDPKETVAPQYKNILEELEKHMTPELIAMKNKLLEEMVTRTQKAPAIRIAKDKAEEGLEEGLGDTLKSIKAACRKFFSSVLNWGKDYDARLDALKAQVAMGESILDEKDGNHPFLDKHAGEGDIKWGALLSKGWGKLTKSAERKSADQADQRKKNKLYRDAREGIEEEGNPLSETPDDQDPRVTGQEIPYRGWVIGYDSESALWTGEGYYCHVEGWEPGDPDGEDGTRSTAGHYVFKTIQDCKDQIDDDLDGEPLVKEDGDWYSQDDFQDYNDAEADDYRNEGDDESALEVEDGVLFGAKLLGIELQQFFPGDDVNNQQAKQLANELSSYTHKVYVQQGEDGQSVDFYCADHDSVNFSGHPLATAWIDENGHFYYEA